MRAPCRETNRIAFRCIMCDVKDGVCRMRIGACLRRRFIVHIILPYPLIANAKCQACPAARAPCILNIETPTCIIAITAVGGIVFIRIPTELYILRTKTQYVSAVIRNRCVRLDAVAAQEPSTAIPLRCPMRKERKRTALRREQITHPKIVLIDHVVILNIILPYIIRSAFIPQGNIGLTESLKVPIRRIVILYMIRGYIISCLHRPSGSTWRNILACRWINRLRNFSVHIGVVAVQCQ